MIIVMTHFTSNNQGHDRSIKRSRKTVPCKFIRKHFSKKNSRMFLSED